MDHMPTLGARSRAGHEIERFLQANARGRRAAIAGRSVAERICYNGTRRSFRKIYQHLGIGSCDDGIFWPADWDDVVFYRAYLERTYDVILAARKIKALLERRPDLQAIKAGGVQLSLPLLKTGPEMGPCQTVGI